ncbi:MAG TPA: response regulator, partial [Methanomassiliicoccales archaeon]|nr:response regulator [Methanomassiliicoccales archaeon]
MPIVAFYIDDDPALLEIAKAFLEHEGEIQVETATSPLEALVRLETQTFDAVICDYQMPNVDGIQFLKTMRNQGRDTPFILFTGKGREDVAIDALNNGADFYLQKGGDPRAQFTELKNMLQRSVAQRRAMESLRESEEMYEKLFHDNAEAMILVDIKSGLLEDGNTAACALFKYSKEELLRKRVQDLLLGLDGSHSQT